MAQFNSFDELENDKSKWTLDSDQKLLNTLQATSEKTLNTIQKLCDNFQASSDAVNKSTSKIDNLMTSVLLLSNSKFVENRVYDEDINEIQKSNAPAFQPKKNEQSKVEAERIFMDNLKASIVIGSQQLQNKLGLHHDDIQTLDRINLVNNLYRKNDPFSKVPLPYLIGSADFINATFAGLKTSPDNSPIRLSEHPSAFNYDNVHETTPTHVNHNAAPLTNYQSDDYDEDEIFHEPVRHQSFMQPKTAPTKPKNSLFSPVADDDEDDDDDLFSASIVRSRTNSAPKVIPSESAQPVAPPEKEPLPDIMSQLAAQIKNRAVQRDSLSPSSSSSSLSKDQIIPRPFIPAAKSMAVQKVLPKSIFDSDQDSDDDLFTKPNKKPSTVDNKSDGSYKSDSVLSFNTSTPTTTTTNSNIDVRSRSSASSNSTLSTDVNMTKNRMKSIFNSDDDDDDVDIFSNSSKNKSAAVSKKNLFQSDDDDDDDDLFGGKGSKPKAQPKPVENKQNTKIVEKVEPKLVVPKEPAEQKTQTKNISKSTLFEDDEDEDDLFQQKNTPSRQTKTAKTPLFSPNVINELNSKFSKNLTVQESPEPKEDLKEPEKVVAAKEQPVLVKSNSKYSSLFGDDDDDDLFGSAKAPKPIQKKPEIVAKPASNEQWKTNSVNVTQNDNTNIHKPDGDSASHTQSKQEPNPPLTVQPQTPQKSMFSTNFLSELNSTLAKKSPLSNETPPVEKSDEKESNDNDAEKDSPIVVDDELITPEIEKTTEDEHFKILKNKVKLNTKRKRKLPSRGHFTKLASSFNDSDFSSFDDSQEFNDNSVLTSTILENNDQPSDVNLIVEEKKEEIPKPAVLEIDIEIALPKQTVPEAEEKEEEAVLEKENVPVEEKVPEEKTLPKTVLKKSMFDSDDSDSDLFGTSSKTVPIRPGTVSLSKTPTPTTNNTPSSAVKPTIPSNLFGSDSDDETEVIQKPTKVAVQTQKRLAAKKSIFDDDSDDDLFKS